METLPVTVTVDESLLYSTNLKSSVRVPMLSYSNTNLQNGLIHNILKDYGDQTEYGQVEMRVL